MSAAGAPRVVVMGVSAAGKSTVALLLAGRIGAAFIDADDLHSAADQAKMRAGAPLTDEDRMPWLDRVAGALAESGDAGAVIACSALRREYRDRIRSRTPGAVFIHLHGDDDLLSARAAARTGHFMPASLLRSQIDTLEMLGADEDGVILDVAPAADAVALAAFGWLNARGS